MSEFKLFMVILRYVHEHQATLANLGPLAQAAEKWLADDRGTLDKREVFEMISRELDLLRAHHARLDAFLRDVSLAIGRPTDDDSLGSGIVDPKDAA